VGHAWLLDPAAHTLEMRRLQDGAWTVVGTWSGAAAVRAEPFADIELSLADLWAG
jgi:hypothetical protein